ncbi:MAG: exopolysaccharide biosynthesis protein [Bacilli bacterium]|nr:exopolysaccharide biosynthesis protein [Bacilli bacterium]
MILVTLGTQDKPFTRLLDAIQREIDKGNIKDKVVVQAGCTKYETDDMEMFDLIPIDEFDKLMSECDLLITHGGVGSIITGLKNNKKVIAVPRLAKYGEHINDHQKQIIDKFNDAGNIIGVLDLDELDKALKKVKSFKPKKYKSNTSNMIELVEKLIDE